MANEHDRLRRSREALDAELERAGAKLRDGMFCCPFHPDKHPSAERREGKDGVWRFRCFAASCGFSGDIFDVRAKIENKPLADVLREAGGQTPKAAPAVRPVHRPSDKPKGGTFESVVRWIERDVGGTHEATYHYPDVGGKGFRVLRIKTPGGKTFRPVYGDDASGWRLGDPHPDGLPLYRRDDLRRDEAVMVLEGEKAVEAAVGVGLNATTSAHGSKQAKRSDWSPLALVAEIWIMPDNDESGRRYGRDVAAILIQQNPSAVVRVVDLPDLPEHGDIVELIESRDSRTSEEIKAEIKALAERTRPVDPTATLGGPVLVCMADVEAVRVEWLWPGRVPLGRITLLVGRPGEGKSFLTIDMAARVTTGTPWPDGSECCAGSVIFITAEDGPRDTIKPRLAAHHANCRRVHLLPAVRRVTDKGELREVMFTLADVEDLEAALKRHPDCKLIVVDPIGSFLGGETDAHRDNEVRSVLAPVARLAERYGPAVLVVAHRRKSGGSFADDLALGSRAFTGIARAVWHLGRDKDDKARRLLLPGKCNLAPEGDGLAFTICGEPPRIVWEKNPVAMTADEALAAENENGKGKPGPEPETMTQAAEWLAVELGDGQEHPVATLRDAAKDAGLSWRSVQRASHALGVKVHRGSFGGGCVWRLPKAGSIRATSRESQEHGTNGNIGVSAQEHGGNADSQGHECHTCQDDFLGADEGDGGDGEDIE